MSNDPFANPPHDATNPYRSPTSENKPSALPPLQSGLGSLGQEARLKNLNTAKWIMIVVGILTIGSYVFQYTTVEKVIDEAFAKELQKQGLARHQVDQAAYNQARDTALLAARVICMVFIGIGFLYIVMGLLVKKYPVPLTIIGLLIYVGSVLLFAVLDPISLVQGIIIKIFIVIGLIKAVQAAIAYERERKAAAALEFGA
jgi:hypothetical protein